MTIKKCPGIAMFAEEDITNNQFISYPVTVRLVAGLILL